MAEIGSMATSDIGPGGNTEGDQQKRLLDLGINYPDVPVTASCPYFQSAEGFSVGLFLNRGLRKETSLPVQKTEFGFSSELRLGGLGVPVISTTGRKPKISHQISTQAPASSKVRHI